MHLHNRAGSTLTLTAESRTPPVINCSPVGKADSCILCQGVTQPRLETSMKTQVTDAALVKTGGVHFAMTVSEWSINSQNLPAGLRVSEAGQKLNILDDFFLESSPPTRYSGHFSKCFQNAQDWDVCVCHLLRGHQHDQSWSYHTAHNQD